MRNMKKLLIVTMTATLLFSSMTVNATPAITAKQNADYMMSTNNDGASNWFVGKYYSDSYADLKVAFGTNEKELYNHSLQYGFDESRLVTPVLDVAKYREFYPDLQNAFGNNWNLYVKHYFEYGIDEGRENFTDFDAQAYLNRYEDLQNVFGTDLGLATRHYIEYGYSEGRDWQTSIGMDFTFDSESSDSTSPDNDYTDESFTGDVRVDLTDGMYVIKTYVNGVVSSSTYYNFDGTEEYKIIFTYNENNTLVSGRTSYADGSTSETTYYETGIAKTETYYRADGTKIYYDEFNEEGCVTLSIEYEEDGVTEYQKTTYTYDEDGNVISSTDYTAET